MSAQIFFLEMNSLIAAIKASDLDIYILMNVPKCHNHQVYVSQEFVGDTLVNKSVSRKAILECVYIHDIVICRMSELKLLVKSLQPVGNLSVKSGQANKAPIHHSC